MESHEIIKKCFGKKSPKEISAEIGVSLSLLYKWAEPGADDGGSGASNPLDRTAQLVRLTREDDILHWLCKQGGGFFVHDPEVGTHKEELTVTVNALVKHFALLLGDLAHTSADHRITAEEASRLRSAWDDLRTKAESFIRACEQGEFETLKEQSAKKA